MSDEIKQAIIDYLYKYADEENPVTIHELRIKKYSWEAVKTNLKELLAENYVIEKKITTKRYDANTNKYRIVKTDKKGYYLNPKKL